MIELLMPKLGVTMTEGTITKWRVSVGDKVKKGDVIVDIEGDKITVPYESPEEGVVKELIAKEGEEIQVGQVICLLEA